MIQSIIHRLTLSTLSLTLTGCMMVGPDYVKPVIEVPQQWRFAAEDAKQVANLSWWEQMGDPVLNQLIDTALVNNLDLKIAIAHVDRFMGHYSSVYSGFFPQISAQIGHERSQASAKGFFLGAVIPGADAAALPITDTTQLGLLMNWELDVWGQLRRNQEAATADLLTQESARNAVILTLVSTVAQTYLELRTHDRRLSLAKQALDTVIEEHRIIKSRFDSGFIAEQDLTQAAIEVERSRAVVSGIDQQIGQAEHALCLLMGKAPGPIERGKTLDELNLPSIPVGLPAEQLLRRPDVAQAEQQLIAANARIGVARGEYFPKISLTGDVGQASMELAQLMMPGANFWTLGGRLLGPLFNAGKTAGQVKMAEADHQAALAEYEKTALTALREVDDALLANLKTTEQYQLQAKQLALVEQQLDLARTRHTEGFTSPLEVQSALRAWYAGQTALAQAKSTTLQTLIQLYRAMGGGWLNPTSLTQSPSL